MRKRSFARAVRYAHYRRKRETPALDGSLTPRGGARSLSTLARGSRIFRQFSERGRALIIQYVIVRHGRGDRHVDLFFLQNTGRNIGSASAFAGRRSTIASSRIWLP